MTDDHTVIGRAVAILDAVTQAAGAPISLAALTRRTGVPKSTVRRIADDLVARQMLASTPEGYLPGKRLIQQGMHAALNLGLVATVQPYLQELHLRSRGELAWFATVHNGELVITGTVFGQEYGSVITGSGWPTMSALGTSLVLTAAGRLQIAHHPDQAEYVLGVGCRPLTRYSITDRNRLRYLLNQARDTGLATEAEQVIEGWSCSAAVVRDANGNMTGALGLIGHNGDIARRLAAHVHTLSKQLEDESRTRQRCASGDATHEWWCSYTRGYTGTVPQIPKFQPRAEATPANHSST
ncbi:IclR family transcriptional regulator C-terminal domain-containing protein [Nocardia sp. NPDC046763]|uniref:IclR family transcriptional regulator n=1 Tax=Nocardia sp. NPDC046763 TaxID=3155256 RepID=UPI0033D974BA